MEIRFARITTVLSLLLLLFNATYKIEMNKPLMRTETIVRQNEVIGTNPSNSIVIELVEIEKDPILCAESEEIDVTENKKYHGQKTYEYYTAITNKKSKQYQIQQYAETDEQGFRTVDDRYLIAVGTYFDAPVGTYIDLTLENGTEIPCIVGDIKADKDTDELNVFSKCGCCSEFMVAKSFVDITGCKGDVSKVIDGWNSKVVTMTVYDYNYFN